MKKFFYALTTAFLLTTGANAVQDAHGHELYEMFRKAPSYPKFVEELKQPENEKKFGAYSHMECSGNEHLTNFPVVQSAATMHLKWYQKQPETQDATGFRKTELPVYTQYSLLSISVLFKKGNVETADKN